MWGLLQQHSNHEKMTLVLVFQYEFDATTTRRCHSLWLWVIEPKTESRWRMSRFSSCNCCCCCCCWGNIFHSSVLVKYVCKRCARTKPLHPHEICNARTTKTETIRFHFELLSHSTLSHMCFEFQCASVSLNHMLKEKKMSSAIVRLSDTIMHSPSQIPYVQRQHPQCTHSHTRRHA